jgi:hypothetical protein
MLVASDSAQKWKSIFVQMILDTQIVSVTFLRKITDIISTVPEICQESYLPDYYLFILYY